MSEQPQGPQQSDAASLRELCTQLWTQPGTKQDMQEQEVQLLKVCAGCLDA